MYVHPSRFFVFYGYHVCVLFHLGDTHPQAIRFKNVLHLGRVFCTSVHSHSRPSSSHCLSHIFLDLPLSVSPLSFPSPSFFSFKHISLPSGLTNGHTVEFQQLVIRSSKPVVVTTLSP